MVQLAESENVKVLKGSERGFTLIEILVVIGIIAILAAIVIIAINPARQFKQAHDSQRVSNVNAVLNAIGQNMADNKGVFTCATALPSTATVIKSTGLDIRTCLVPTYLPELPADPVTGTSCADAACSAGYNSGYSVVQDATTGRVTVSAVGEITTAISVTR